MEHLTPPRRITLSSLPNEILSLILGNFCRHCFEQRDGHGTSFTPQSFVPSRVPNYWVPSWVPLDCHTLYAVCLVSTRFHEVGQRVLYHQFIPGDRDSGSYNNYSWSRRLLPFLRTVARRRDLAALVRHAQLELQLFDGLSPNHVQDVLGEVADALGIDLPHFLAQFGDQPRPTGRSGTACPQTDELITMLIACLPNLTRINLAGGGAFRSIPLPALRAAHATNLQIHAIDCSCIFGFADSCLDGIFELAPPSLTTLSLNFARQELLRSVANTAPHSLRHLYITGSEVRGDDLAALLSRCVVLETFVFEADIHYYIAANQTKAILPPGPVKHLVGNRGTLRVLHLDFRASFHIGPEFVNVIFLTELTPQLSNFPVLRTLFLNTAFVYGTGDDSAEGLTVLLGRILPPSIVSLTMVESARISPRLAILAADLRQVAEAARQGQFPRLKTIVCDTPGPLEDTGLGDLFGQAGVEFRYDVRPLSGRFRRRK